MSAKDKDWQRKNIVAMGRAPSARRPAARVALEKMVRKSDPTIRERQSAWSGQAKRTQPSMPTFNLPPVRDE